MLKGMRDEVIRQTAREAARDLYEWLTTLPWDQWAGVVLALAQ